MKIVALIGKKCLCNAEFGCNKQSGVPGHVALVFVFSASTEAARTMGCIVALLSSG